MLNEIIAGLSCYNVINVMREQPLLFEHVFCISKEFQWKLDCFVSYLRPEFSEIGSNKRTLELGTYKALLDFVEECFEDGKYSIFHLFTHKMIYFVGFHHWTIFYFFSFRNILC